MSGSPGGQQIELLFVDDEEDNFTALRQRLSQCFEDLGCPVRLTFQAEPDEACRMIADRQTPYQVVVADLLFAPGGAVHRSDDELDSRGLDVIKDARRASEKTVIVAITLGLLKQPQLQDEAAKAGADIVRLRPSLHNSHGGPKGLVDEIYNVLCERELVEAGPEVVIDDEPGIQTVETDTGRATLRLLLSDLLSGHDSKPVRAELTYVTPGNTGAHVVAAKVLFSGGRRRSYLMKLSKDQEALKREHHNVEWVSGLYRPDLVVPPIWNSRMPVGPRNNWSAVVYAFADAAVPLREWLSRPDTTPASVDAFMDQLFFHGGLAAGYQQRYESEPGRKPVDMLRLPPFRRNRLRTAVKELAPMLAHPMAGALADAEAVLDELERFSRTGAFGGLSRDETPGDLRLVEAHGDLHGKNILVTTTGRRGGSPAVIDLADFGQHHWAADLARLTADILLECVDRGVGSTLWQRFAAWRALARSVGGLTPSSDESNPAAAAAFSWVAERRVELMPLIDHDTHRWEWHVALAEQLLRGASRSRHPHPKRALALVAAYDQLLLARDSVPRPGKTF